jgi:hypothetical protein
MNKKTYITPTLSVVMIRQQVSILAGSGDKAYGDAPVSGAYQMSRRGGDWDVWANDDTDNTYTDDTDF